MSNRAWVTLATNDSYGLGALVLAHSLRRAGSAYPAVVLITPSVTEAMSDRLRAVYADVVTVDVLDSRDATHLALLQRPELGITFTKIHCWSLTQYEKCVFLDADTLVVQNSDELFDREELSAAPDVGWPDCFNSGVFVFRPSADTFNELIKFAKERGSFDGGDQGLLNSFFSDWAHGDINKHLPFLYNVTSAAFYSYLPALKHYGQNLKIIHFIGAVKPWLQQYNWETRTVGAPDHLRELLQLWWDLFVSQVHCQLDTTMSGVAGNLARVVPGSGFQREALDELTRRQGWEAGNIDYMGADSFDNIWAKISQTLSQPRSSPAKQSPPKELAPSQPVAQPVEVAKEVVPGEAPVVEAAAVVEAPVPVESAVPIEIPASVKEPASVAVTADETATAPEVPIKTPIQSETPALIPTPVEAPVEIPACVEETVTTETPTPEDVPKTVDAVVESSPQAPVAPSEMKNEVESVEPAKVPLSDAPTPSAVEIPKEEAPVSPAVELEQVAQVTKAAPSLPIPAPEVPASPAVPEQEASPEKPAVSAASTDSPPLANTPSKEEAPAVPAAKSVERRKPAGKLQLSPPAAADPLPTPDSELEDAASLAQSIIASELRTPTVTSPQPAVAAAAVAAPSAPTPALASSAPPATTPAQEKRLTVEEPEVPTPPVGAISLAQIGVKPTPKGKASTAAQIESSVSPQSPAETSAPAAPAEVPKKKVVKKVVKKEGATSGEAPVPPPRKKEKKPKEK